MRRITGNKFEKVKVPQQGQLKYIGIEAQVSSTLVFVAFIVYIRIAQVAGSGAATRKPIYSSQTVFERKRHTANLGRLSWALVLRS